ncbi:gliding motility-associated C-terminal domain-containing protein [bacterium]|nr:gliding motility-associated C-terminal domain-containing protein [bacterium]
MKYRLFFALLIIIPFALWAQTPTLYSVSPDTGAQGSSLTILLSGTNFVSGPALSTDFGAGITVTSLVYITSAFLRANIDIDIAAPLGTRDVIVTNPSGAADTLFDGFWIIDDDVYPPVGRMIFPPCSSYISCADTAIIVALWDEHEIDTLSIEVVVNGFIFDISSPELTFFSSPTETLLIFRPSLPAEDGEYHYAITELADTLGNSIGLPLINCSFWVDLTPPVLWNIHPDPGGTTRETYPRISFYVADSGSGLDTSSITITIGGITYSWGHPSLRWGGDSLVWTASMAGREFYIGDTVVVCLDSVSDRSEYCGANSITDTCWSFVIYIPPPSDINLSIRQVAPDNFPLIQSLVYVTDEDDRTVEGLTARNFIAHEDGTRQYPLIVRNLGGGGMADIVFVIDDTGSMGWIISDVQARVGAFADSLAMIGINYRLGLVTFKDETDFDGTRFGLGYELTSDIDLFQDMVDGVVASGGGDGPETSLDAIADALHFLEFRPGARIVIIMITDNNPHYRGDGTTYSDITLDECVDSLLSYNSVCFVVSSDYYSSFYTGPGTLTDETGGTWYDLDYPFDEILEQISEFIRGGYYVSYTTSNSVADCGIRHLNLEVQFVGLDDDDETPFMAPCGPAGEIIKPLNGTNSSNSRQEILMVLNEPHEGINDTTIQFVVEEVLYTVYGSPELSFSDDTLYFYPSVPFTHRQEVNVILAQVLDGNGHSPFSGPIEWEFYVDLRGPVVSNVSPLPDTVLNGPDRQTPIIRMDITDDLAGVREASILIKITAPLSGIDVNFSVYSDGIAWNGTTFVIDPEEVNLHFLERDTVCVRVIRAVDNPDYGDPNSMIPYEWCFYIQDDDTLCPEFTDFSPQHVEENLQFYIQCAIEDASGVYDDLTGSEGYGVYLEWTPDGSLEDMTDNYEEQMERFGGDIFRALIPGQDENASFIYRVCAYDDDFDDSLSIDRSFCCSDTQRISFRNITGPIATLIQPDSSTWTTNANQSIAIRIVDDANGVDPSTIHLNVAGLNLYVNGTTVIYDADSILWYYPESPNLFTDGQTVNCQLIAADDNVGNELQNPFGWTFRVDLTGPVGTTILPPAGSVTEDYQQDIILTVEDELREVNISTIQLRINETLYIIGDPGIHWDLASHTLSFIPEDIPLSFVDGESACVTLEAADDLTPDYGLPNPLYEILRWCFIPSISVCSYSPNVFTPNGDGYNDVVTFTYPHMYLGGGTLTIFTLDEEEIRTVHGEAGDFLVWDGTNNRGNPAPRGIYIWIIVFEDEIVCNGSVTLIR